MKLFHLFIVILISGACSSFPATAQDTTQVGPPNEGAEQVNPDIAKRILRDFSPRIVTWQATINRHKEASSNRFLSHADTQAAINELETVRPELRSYVDELKPRLSDATVRLEKLGPLPKEKEQEASSVAQQRKVIANEVAAYDGLIKRAEVLFVQAGQVIGNYNSTRRKQFLSGLLRRSDNLGNLDFWRSGLSSLSAQIDDIAERLTRLLQDLVASWQTTLFTIILTLGLTLGLSSVFQRVLRAQSYPAHREGESISRSKRGAMALRRAVSVTAPVAVTAVVFFLICKALDAASVDTLQLLGRCLIYLVVGLFYMSVLYFALRPAKEQERLIAIDERSARSICLVGQVFVGVWMVDQFLELWDQELSSPFSLVVLRTFVVAMTYGLLMAAFLAIRVRRSGAHPAARRTNGWPRRIFGILALWVTAIVVSALLGYVSLARFLGAQFVATGGLVLLISLVHLAAEYVSSPAVVASDDEDVAQRPTMFAATIGVAAGIGLDALVLLIGLPLLLLQWGYEVTEVRGWVSSAFFGFQVGGIRISLLQILTAVGIVIAGLILTRIVRNMFLRRSEYMFSSSTGARESLATILSYVGFVLSIVAALSYVGMDVSNLALIAGALSVGIGFGLQSIANNFVSGLILLAERPIKVGDWIIVGNDTGFVQKISVRSTQIRTLDRSTLIVPNADLITNSVTNWDHGDSVGRVLVNVGVSYSSDAKTVLKLLMEVGRAHPAVIHQHRSPLVIFEGFGDSSLDFSLRVMVRNIRDLPIVQTDLRVAILDAFRENNIEIPFPQRDLHLKTGEIQTGNGEPNSTSSEDS